MQAEVAASWKPWLPGASPNIMKILLVNPQQIYSRRKWGRSYHRIWPPLCLANCAAVLEQQGYEVKLIDVQAEDLSPDEVARKAVGFNKVFITSTSVDRWYCPYLDIQPFLSTVKSVGSVVEQVFVLGAHGTLNPKEMLNLTGARAIVRGEPEETVLDLCRTDNLLKVKGITFREEGEVISNETRRPLDLASLPIPAFHLLAMEKYRHEVLGLNFTLFEASREGVSRYAFPFDGYRSRTRRKPVENTLREIHYAVAKFGIKTAYFIGPEFTGARDQVLKLCDGLIQRDYDFHWACQTRPELIDKELLQKMKRAGCRLIYFVIDAGNDKVPEAGSREMTSRQIEDKIKSVHTLGIESACFFMVDFLKATGEEMERILRLARRINPTYAFFHVTVPYSGTGFPGFPGRINGSSGRFFDEGPFLEIPRGHLTLEELKRLIHRAYWSYYLRPTYICSRLIRGNLQSLTRQLHLFRTFL